jgi:predicted ATPase
MIQRLRIRGFRSLKDVTWEPGKLNVVIGPNGSGKSNLLRALRLLQRSAHGELPAQVLRQGGIAALLWDGQAQELAWDLKTDPLGSKRDPLIEALTYELRLRQLGGSSAYRIEHELLAKYHLKDIGRMAEPMKFLERRPGHVVTFDFQERHLTAHEGSVPDDQTLLSLVAGPFGNPLVLAFRDRLASWRIYHDVQVHEDAPVRQAAVARLETRVSPDGQDLVPVLHTLYSRSGSSGRLLTPPCVPPSATTSRSCRSRRRPTNASSSACGGARCAVPSPGRTCPTARCGFCCCSRCSRIRSRTRSSPSTSPRPACTRRCSPSLRSSRARLPSARKSF